MSENNPKISGERRFLHYAYPCVESLEHRGAIDPVDKQALDILVDSPEDPSHELLARCFATPVWDFTHFAYIDPLALAPWPLDKVTAFWRQHRHDGPRRDSDTMKGIVNTDSSFYVRVFCGDKMLMVVNRYRFPVSPGNIVYFHNLVITEVEKKV